MDPTLHLLHDEGLTELLALPVDRLNDISHNKKQMNYLKDKHFLSKCNITVCYKAQKLIIHLFNSLISKILDKRSQV